MKKILSTCFILLWGVISAQIVVNESFEGTSLPSGWSSSSSTYQTFGTNAGAVCAGAKSLNYNLWSSASTWNVTYSSSMPSNGELTYSFKYLSKPFDASTSISGNVSADYSVNGGTTWVTVMPAVTISGTSAIPCTTVSGTIPAGTIPAGSNFRFRLKAARTSPGDFFVGFDDVQLSQPITAAPSCTTVSAPVANATGVSLTPTFTWAAAGGANSYVLSLGTSPGGSDIISNLNVGNVTSYPVSASSPLSYQTQYYLKVTPQNNIGSASGCTETAFTTLNMPCPSVSLPSSNATAVSTLPTFSWSAVAGASGYRISLGTTSGGTDVLSNVDLGNVTEYTYSGPALNLSTTYYYTITSYNPSVSSTGCTVRSFTTASVGVPNNDNCSGAVLLTVNPGFTCTSTTSGNTLGASQSMVAGVCSGTPDDDVWYSFTATASSHIISLTNTVSTGTTSSTDMYFQVLSGTCGSQTSLLCSDPDSNLVSGLTPGVMYYVRVYSYYGSGYNQSFNICVLTVPSPPANDNCANAATLTINADMNCGTVTSGTTLGATSSGVALGSCSGTADDDVWYKFVAAATTHTIQLKNIVSVGTASSTSLYAQVFSGDCSTLTGTRCISSNANFTYLSGLVVGQTYYVRVYNSESNSGASVYSNTFDICMGTLPSAPANDDCASPINLAVNGTLTCASPTSGTTFGATNSSVAVGSCTGTPDDDVWYSFTAVGTDHTVLLSNVTSVGSSSSTSLNTQIFSGVCGTLTSIKCGTTNTTVVNGLTPGALYYVRVYNSNANTATALYANTFNICIGTPPPPPANDNIAGAFTLTVNPDYACGTVTPATTESATASTPAPSCTAAGANDDVWFKFIATNAVHRVSLANTSGSADMNMVVYGADGTTELTSAVGGACANVSTKNLTGLTVGNTYFVRVYTNSSSSTTISSFTVCVGTPPPAPVNDNIGSAINLVPSATGICSSSVTGTTVSATQSVGETAPTCSATGINDDVWYSFTATSTTHLVNVDYSDNATTTQVYSGTSGSLVAVGCFDGAVGNSNVLLNSLAIGNTYYVRVYSTPSTATTTSNFQICISTPVVPTNDLQTGAIALNACAGTTVNGNNALATDETLPASTCGSTGSIGSYKGVWFTVTPAINGAVTVETCGSKYDTYLRIYTDSSGTLTCFSNTSGVGYDDDSCAEALYGSSKLTFNGVAGTTYYVLLTGYAAARIGEYSIKATQDCSSLATGEIASNKTTAIKAYPNPFADLLTISDVKGVKSIMISDMSGKIVRTITKPEATLRLADLNSGMYLVILNMNDGSRQTIKAIKK